MRVIRGLGALLALVVGTVGVPVLLAAIGGRLPRQWSSAAVAQALLRPDDGRLLIGVITAVAWVAWLVFAISVLVELVDLVSHHRVRIRVPGLGVPQRAAAGLLLLVLAMVVLPHPAPARSAPHAAPPSTSTSARAVPASSTAEDRAADRSPTERRAHGARDSSGPGSVVHVVRAGDDLWSLAERYYGQGEDWRKIARANPTLLTGGPDRLEVGWRLVVPGVVRTGAGEHRVRPDETLSVIADQVYGHADAWPGLWRANRATVADPDLIEVDQLLTLPERLAVDGTTFVRHGSGSAASGRPAATGPTASDHQGRRSAGASGRPPADARTREQSGEQPRTPSPTPTAGSPAATTTPSPPAQTATPSTEPSASGPATADPSASGPATADPSGSGRPTLVPPQSEPGSERPAPSLVEAMAENAPGIAGVGGVLAAGLVAGLVMRRRLQLHARPVGRRIAQPPTAAQLVEARLGRQQDPIGTDTLDLALRAVARHAGERGEQVPLVLAAAVSAERLELRLAATPGRQDVDRSDPQSAVPTPPSGFTVHGDRWRLDRESAARLGRDPGLPAAAQPYPAMVTVGTDGDGVLHLVNLEAAGLLTVVGPDATSVPRRAVGGPDVDQTGVPAVLAALLTELAFSRWADDVIVTVVGTGTGLVEAIDRPTVSRVDDLDRLLDRWEHRAVAQRAARPVVAGPRGARTDRGGEAPDRPSAQHPADGDCGDADLGADCLGADGPDADGLDAEFGNAVLAHRVRPELADPWVPEIALIERVPSADQRDRLERLLLTEPPVAMAAVVPGRQTSPAGDGSAAAAWRLRLSEGSDGSAMLEPLGLQLDPQRLSGSVAAALRELVVYTGSAQTTPAPWWAPPAEVAARRAATGPSANDPWPDARAADGRQPELPERLGPEGTSWQPTPRDRRPVLADDQDDVHSWSLRAALGETVTDGDHPGTGDATDPDNQPSSAPRSRPSPDADSLDAISFAESAPAGPVPAGLTGSSGDDPAVTGPSRPPGSPARPAADRGYPRRAWPSSPLPMVESGPEGPGSVDYPVDASGGDPADRGDGSREEPTIVAEPSPPGRRSQSPESAGAARSDHGVSDPAVSDRAVSDRVEFPDRAGPGEDTESGESVGPVTPGGTVEVLRRAVPLPAGRAGAVHTVYVTRGASDRETAGGAGRGSEASPDAGPATRADADLATRADAGAALEAASGLGAEPHPVVNLLGPIELLGTAGTVPGRAVKQCIEYCAWLLEHPGSTAPAMAGALAVAEGTRRSNVSRLRTWLGEDGQGGSYLPEAYSGRIRLAPTVTSDWHRLQLLTRSGVNLTGTEGLVSALRLVRGAPLADAAPGQWHWAEELRTDMISVVRDIAVELSRRALAAGDVTRARWAAARGLTAAPRDEQLMAARIRAEHRAGNLVEVERLSLEVSAHARWLGLDLDPETVDLLQQVLEGRLRART